MSKYKITKKAVKELYGNKIISVGYCNLQNLLNGNDPFAYSSRVEGWACDYYEIPRGICISTGYSPIGKHIDYDFCRKYDEAASEIIRRENDWEVIREKLNNLLADFAGDVEARYYKGKGAA